MDTTVNVFYSDTNNTLVQITKITDVQNNNTTEIYVKVNINEETIIQSGDNQPRPLMDYDMYTFRAMFSQVELSEGLVTKVLNMKYMKTYLAMNVSVNEVQFHPFVNYLFLFSQLVIPFQNIDWEKVNKSKYASKIQEVFNKTNSVSMYKLKKVGRYLLLIPGLIFSPIIMIGVLVALSKMS